MRFIKKQRKSWSLMLLVVTLVMLAWVAVPLVQGATITVTSTADSGPGTLREALSTAVSGDTITFDPAVFPPGAPATIALTSPLPGITQGNLTIDGTGAGVIIDGSGTPEDTVGISITSNDNTIKGLQILNFPGDGVAISGGAKDNTIGGDTPEERNVISGNGGPGVSIEGSGTDANTVIGNYIGTDANGTADLGNSGQGVTVWNGAQSNTIGGDTPGERNVISGNGRYGIHICDEGTDGNVVSGNYIGTDASGTAPLANEDSGVQIDEGAQNNTVGGDTPEERNVVSGNDCNGVVIDGSDTTGNTVIGNYIGTNASGTAPLPNGCNGMDIGAPSNTIGGLTPTARNVVSGNGANGVMLAGPDSHNNTVMGNYIGTDASGTGALPNTNNGVAIQEGAASNTVTGNVIAHNSDYGVMVDGSDSTGNTISHNSITANGGLGIDNLNGGNTELIPPTIVSASCSSVSGTAPANSTVEIFSDPADEGKRYEGTTTADATGAFTWTGSITGPNVTATATDGAGNTSEFSDPLALVCYRVYLPLVTKNYQ